MANQPLKGAARVAAAWRNSRAGFTDIWREEEAFRIELVMFIVSIPVAVLITDTALHAALLIAVGLFLLVVEVLNSAIEAVVDRIGPERHELSRKAKDLGSLAVLPSTLLLAVVWLAALWQWALG